MQLPPLDLLKKTHVFPGTYIFKAVGMADTHFAERVVAAVRDELQLDHDPEKTSTRSTDSGKHLAITIEVTVLSAEQIHDVYNRIAAVPGLIIML